MYEFCENKTLQHLPCAWDAHTIRSRRTQLIVNSNRIFGYPVFIHCHPLNFQLCQRAVVFTVPMRMKLQFHKLEVMHSIPVIITIDFKSLKPIQGHPIAQQLIIHIRKSILSVTIDHQPYRR